MKFLGWLKTLVIKIVPQVDNWILICLAVFFAIGGLTGMAAKILNPIIVGMLGILAISQFRSRSQVSTVTATWHRARTDIFVPKFPPEYLEAQKKVTHSYFFAGITMFRTMPMMRQHISRILANEGSVRILLPDPTNEHLLEMIAEIRPGQTVDDIRDDIKHSLRIAGNLRGSTGKIEIRTIQFIPNIGINAMDLNYPTKSIMVQMYEFLPKPGDERAPIFYLTADDHAWFGHFEAQIERLWAKGRDYIIPNASVGAP